MNCANRLLLQATTTLSILFILAAATASSPPSSTIVGEARKHTVASGEALSGIARQYGLAYPTVARANGIENPNLIRVGRVLTLPTRFILPAQREQGIVINIPENRLFLFRGGIVQAVFPIAVGLPTWQTPVGTFEITSRVENPAWYMPPDLARREHIKREVIPAGPENPLGDFWIGTSLSHTGIHGTNVPMSIGRALSHGCMRLYPEHIDSLFSEVAVGDSGEVLYEPVKVAIDGDDVLVEIHPDIYEKTPNSALSAEKQLRALSVWEKVDTLRFYQAVKEARGIPVSIRKNQ
jgi:L,D-transpeptidase ErfK/SrfK